MCPQLSNSIALQMAFGDIINHKAKVCVTRISGWNYLFNRLVIWGYFNAWFKKTSSQQNNNNKKLF